MKKVDLIIIGAGSRGSVYASYASDHADTVRIVGVADPRPAWRERLARAHDVPAANGVDDWRELATKPKFADAVVIATPDALHTEPAIAFAETGYHILLEKPMAPNEGECRRIVAAVSDAGVIFGVCHVLRYTKYTQAVKKLIDDGAIGEIVNVQRLEPVGYWHQAHSYVRGNWRREDESSSMLLAKCCHDLDWIRYVMGSRCVAVHSFGTLKHFRREQRPNGAASRCISCAVESECPYSAVKIYLRRVAAGETGWPVDILASDVTEDAVREALRTGPYGRCVYDCDNDVVDNQVVNLLFEQGQTASLTMTAFAEADFRQTRIFGSKGELVGDGRTIRWFDFLTDAWREMDTDPDGRSSLDGHGGGDQALMCAFVDAVRHEDQGRLSSGPQETLESHRMVFAAEKARAEQRVVSLDPVDH